MVLLTEQTQAGVDESFSAIVEEYSDLTYNVALRMLRRREEAEDAVQEAFLSAYRAFPSFKGQSKVSTWLYRIVVNACLMRIRKEKTQAKYFSLTALEDSILRDEGGSPERWAENNELHDVIETGLATLSGDLRAVVVLRDVHGLSNHESAEALGISISAFKSRLHRGRVLMRNFLEETEPALLLHAQSS